MRKSYGAAFAGIGIGYAVLCMLTAALILWKRTLQPVRAPVPSAHYFQTKRQFSLSPLTRRPSISLSFSRAPDSSAPSMAACPAGNRHVCLRIVSLFEGFIRRSAFRTGSRVLILVCFHRRLEFIFQRPNLFAFHVLLC